MSFKVKDFYFKKAKKEKFVARSVYKLEEIDQRFKIFSKDSNVLDLGYHPGSWIQYVSRQASQGQVVGLDIKPVNKSLQSLSNVSLLQKDIFEVESPGELGLSGKVDVLISDMAPNTTGIKSVDQDRSLNLVEKVFDFMPLVLKDGGHFVIKVFDGHDAQEFLKTQKKLFEKWNYLKPKSTRSVSKEFFVIGKSYKGEAFHCKERERL